MASNVEPMLVEKPQDQFKKPQLLRTVIRHAINNFSTCVDEQVTKHSPSDPLEPQFYLTIYPNKDGNISFYLHATKNVRAAHVVEMFFNDHKQRTDTGQHYFNGPARNWGWKSFCKRSDFLYDGSKFVENGDLVLVKYTIYYWQDDNEHEFGNLLLMTDFDDLKTPPVTICEQVYKAMRGDSSLAKGQNVVINFVDGQSIIARKEILCAASDYFMAMFENTDSIEAQTNTIDIVDFDYKTVKAMIDWIYDEYVPESDLCVELLRAADKYQLDRLKFECERLLMNDVTLENVLDTLVIADKFSAKKLKSVVMDLIVNNRSLLFKDVRVVKETLTVDLMCELMCSMSK